MHALQVLAAVVVLSLNVTQHRKEDVIQASTVCVMYQTLSLSRCQLTMIRLVGSRGIVVFGMWVAAIVAYVVGG